MAKLMTGYDRKRLTLASRDQATITVEVDLTGTGDWHPWRSFETGRDGKAVEYQFPDSFQAYWIRFRSSADTRAIAQLVYD